MASFCYTFSGFIPMFISILLFNCLINKPYLIKTDRTFSFLLLFIKSQTKNLHPVKTSYLFDVLLVMYVHKLEWTRSWCVMYCMKSSHLYSVLCFICFARTICIINSALIWLADCNTITNIIRIWSDFQAKYSSPFICVVLTWHWNIQQIKMALMISFQ